MRKWATSTKKNKNSKQPTYINKTPRDIIDSIVKKNTPCSRFFSYGPPPQNYSRKTRIACNRSNDMKVSKCDLTKTNFQIKNSAIKRVDNKNGIHNTCYSHTFGNYLESRNKQFMEHPEDIKQKKYRETCQTSFCKSNPVCNRIQKNKYSNARYSKSESVSSGSRLHRLKYQTIIKSQSTNKKQNTLNGMLPLRLYKPISTTKKVTELPICNGNKKYCKKTQKWCYPACGCSC